MRNTKIEWCDDTWNPVSGCLHDCEYCYARKIANRFKGCDAYPGGAFSLETGIELNEPLYKTADDGRRIKAAYPIGFLPTFHAYKLKELGEKKFGKTIFVCSMADLFGDWVPDSWIESVFHACLEHPEHRYLFLTKNPGRYLDLARDHKLPDLDNFWYGSTTTGPNETYFYSDKHHTFVSIEPIREPWEGPWAPGRIRNDVEWVIFGAETGNRKDKVKPERHWIEELVWQMSDIGIPIFMKDSMKKIWGNDLLRELPWQD